VEEAAGGRLHNGGWKTNKYLIETSFQIIQNRGLDQVWVLIICFSCQLYNMGELSTLMSFVKDLEAQGHAGMVL